MVIGFSEDSYTGDEGEPGVISSPNTTCSVTDEGEPGTVSQPNTPQPNTPCRVVVEIIERTLEIPLQIQLTPIERNATSKKVRFVPIYYGLASRYILQIIYHFNMNNEILLKVTASNCFGP